MTSIPTMTTCRGRCDEQRPSAWSPSSPPGRSSSSPSTEPSPQPSLPGQKRMEYWMGEGSDLYAVHNNAVLGPGPNQGISNFCYNSVFYNNF